MNRSANTWVAMAVVLLGLAVGLVWGRSPAAVDWRRARAVCLQSDDWGLCGFLPDSTALASLDREALTPGHFPPVYWHSTLEDSAEVSELCQVLVAHRGRDDLPAVLQANYIMASLGYEPAAGDSDAVWTSFELPAVPPGYERPGLWTAVQAGRSAGVWRPELHGRWHYDPERRRKETAADPAVARAAAQQILPFPGSEHAWELGPWRSPVAVRAEFDRNLALFRDLFGTAPRSIMAPDYVWSDLHESLWLSRDLRTIQGQRQQRMASWRGKVGRIQKVAHRTWARWTRQDRTYLERNCLFEPVQAEQPREVTRTAVASVQAAWRRHEPAVVEVHRINFSHLDPAVPALGRRELHALLAAVEAHDPLYLVDAELAALMRHGTSWTRRGERLVVRNLTRSRRLVVVPGDEAGVESAIALSPGEMRLLGTELPPFR